MSWEAWTLVVVMAIGTVSYVGMVGQTPPRRTPSTAVVTLIINAGFVWLILRVAGVL